MRRLCVLLISASALVSMAPAAGAQSRDGRCVGAAATSTAVPDAHAEFCFGDELVSGTLVRPDESSTHVLRHAAGISLIRMRSQFVSEMLKSTENL